MVVSCVAWPNSLYRVGKWVMKWKYGKDNPFANRVVGYKGVLYNGVYFYKQLTNHVHAAIFWILEKYGELRVNTI